MSRIKEYPSITSFDGTNDALAIEQTDGASNRTRKVTPAQLKQYMEAGDFTATGEVKDGHGNILSAVVDQQAVTVTKTSAVTSNSGIVAYICNNFCFVTIDANILSGAVDGTVLATGFTKPIYFAAIGRTTKAFDIMINSSGELIIKGTPTTGWVQGSISYMI